MLTILEDKIFKHHSSVEFEQFALEIFNYQYNSCQIYKEYVNLLGIKNISTLKEIPFLPIEFFKKNKIVSGTGDADLIFKSSGTSSTIRSTHHVLNKNLYIQSFFSSYIQFIGNPQDQVILALLPNYIEQGDSSLVFMVNKLIEATNSELSSFILNDFNQLKSNYDKALEIGKKPVVIGVSYALIDLAEENLDFSNAIIIETGGMKGRRREISKDELHLKLMKGLNVSMIYSEYGMTELLSQAYSTGNALFETPPWMRVLIRDTNDPFNYVEDGKTGGINVIDLANLYSCSFIATQDLGKKSDGKFAVLGRFDNSDIRGCNLLLE